MGRPLGSKNRKSNELKNAVLASLEQIGGIEYLVEQAKANPTAYMALVGKALPREMEIEVSRSAWDAIDEAENANGNPEQTEV